MGIIPPPTYRGLAGLGALPPPPPYSSGLGSLLGGMVPSPPAGGLGSLLGGAIAPLPTYQWAYVSRRFQRFLDNLKLTDAQFLDGQTKIQNVVSSLDRAYWGISDGMAHAVMIGSWAKQRFVRPPRDIDLYFVLPVQVYYRFEERQGNKQSQLLQELRDILRATNPFTDISGDRHVVVVPFSTYKIEVAPVFQRQGGGYLACDTAGLGRYKHVDPAAELTSLSEVDTRYNGSVRKLTRLFKQWQRECNVPIKSFHLEAAIKGALPKFAYSGYSEFWFDWLVRDVFAHLIQCKNGFFTLPGTGESILIGDAWLSRAESAYDRALKACEFERMNQDYLAGAEWQKIFGTEIPISAA